MYIINIIMYVCACTGGEESPAVASSGEEEEEMEEGKETESEQQPSVEDSMNDQVCSYACMS